jgi:3-oxoadipate enol-lactonase
MSPFTYASMGDGCRIAWRFDGNPDKPVLLLSNSLGTDMGMWDAQLPAFTQHFHVLRYDSRGHGKSDAPAGAYSMDRLGRDVIELLDALSLERIYFCGVSKGGMVGQWLGIRAPERVASLVLCNTSSYMGPPKDWDARIAKVWSEGLSSIADASAEKWFTPNFRLQCSSEVARFRATLSSLNPIGYAGCCAAIRDMDMRHTVKLITLPTLVIGGMSDPATPPDHSQRLAESIAHSQLRFLPSAHLSNVECPEAFNELVVEFLTKNSPRRTPESMRGAQVR